MMIGLIESFGLGIHNEILCEDNTVNIEDFKIMFVSFCKVF